MSRPKKQDALDIPRRAVEACIACLAEKGVDGFTMADVAEAVGCRTPALYHHFRGKNALLRAVHDAGFARLYGDKLRLASEMAGDPQARLRAGGKAYLRFALENPALYRLMFSPPPQAGLDRNPFAEDIGRKSQLLLRDAVVNCQAVGMFEDRDPDRIAFMLWSLVHGMASLILQGRAPIAAGDAEALANAVVDTLMDLFIANSTT